MKFDRITHAHQTRTHLHAYIMANPGASAENILHNNARIGKESAKRCMRYLMDLGNIRREGRRNAARYYAVTEAIQPVADIREKLRVAGSCNPPMREKPIPSEPLPAWVTRNVGGSLPSTNQGGQGAVRHEVRRGCSL